MADGKTRREFKRYSLVGFLTSVMDYAILNLLVGMFGLPVIGSNIASTSSSGYVSFMLNRKVVFKDQKHRTLVSMGLYALTIGFGILVLQSIVFFLLDQGELFEAWAGTWVTNDTLAMLIGLNTTKILAAGASGVWNFVILQRFVFVSHDIKKN